MVVNSLSSYPWWVVLSTYVFNSLHLSATRSHARLKLIADGCLFLPERQWSLSDCASTTWGISARLSRINIWFLHALWHASINISFIRYSSRHNHLIGIAGILQATQLLVDRETDILIIAALLIGTIVIEVSIGSSSWSVLYVTLSHLLESASGLPLRPTYSVWLIKHDFNFLLIKY